MNLYGDGIRTWDHSVMKQTCKPFPQHHETKWGSSSSTVVERIPHYIEAVGLIRAGLFYSSIFRNVSVNRSLEEVQHYYFS